MIDVPTHTAGNILDLVLTNVPDNISNLRIHCDPPLLIPSDHFVITFDFYLSSISSHDSNFKATPILNFSRGNYDNLCNHLYNSDFTPCLMSEDIEFVWEYLSNTIRDALPHFIPTTVFQSNNQPVWFNSDIRHHINCLRTLRRKFTNNPTGHNKNKLESSQKLLQAKISNAKTNYETNLITTFDNSKIYKYIRGITKSKSFPSTMYHNSSSFHSGTQKANAFNEYFYSVFNKTPLDLPSSFNFPPESLCQIVITEADVYDALVGLDTSKAMGPDGIPPIVLSRCASVLYVSLHHLFNLTLKFSYLPTEWKVHKIIPVFKSGDPTHINNYRPISLLSNTSKVLERIIYDKIIGHITSQINYAQFGFIQNHSTVQQLLSLLSDIYTSRHQLDIIYLDITKAFDSVPHPQLLYKLSTFNIGGELWAWFLAYLTNRNQFVSINGCNSYLLPVESGVPQGSILGPLLFIIYMNDIPCVVAHSKVLLFADDTKCFRHIKELTDMHLLQYDLDCLTSWSTTSLLSFHPSKNIHLSFKSKYTTSYYINGNTINSSHSHKDLGVWISDNLTWDIHHDYILKKAYKTLGLVRRTFSYTINPSVTVKLYISLIRSQLMYCAPVWRPHLLKDISKIEQLQRRATKHILHDFISDYKTRLMHLNLFPLMYIFEISDIMFFINCLKNPTPSFDVNSYVSFSQSTTRSNSVKLHHNISFTNRERHFYFNRICRLWNSLPIIDVNLPVDTIKRRVKNYLWNHFITHFNSDDPHKFHYLCPCGSCVNSQHVMNFDHL